MMSDVVSSHIISNQAKDNEDTAFKRTFVSELEDHTYQADLNRRAEQGVIGNKHIMTMRPLYVLIIYAFLLETITQAGIHH
jgi:hypothetical protein